MGVSKAAAPSAGRARRASRLIPNFVVAALARVIHWCSGDVGPAPIAATAAALTTQTFAPGDAATAPVDALSDLLDRHHASRRALKPLALVERTLRLSASHDPLRRLRGDVVDGAIRQLLTVGDLRHSADLRQLLLQLCRRRAQARFEEGCSQRRSTRHHFARTMPLVAAHANRRADPGLQPHQSR